MIDTRLYTTQWTLTNLIFTPYLFFKTNVINNISLFYGVHTWHWYLSQGIPFILTSYLPVYIYGLYCIYQTPTIYKRIKTLIYLSIWVIFIYSLLPHKEFRFIFPIVPIFLMISAYGLQRIPKWRNRILLFLTITQLPMALYTTVWHQRGVMDVMQWLRTQPTSSISILMPCHSTPYYSILHKNTPIWFLTCEPPLNATVLDESDEFYRNPIEYLNSQENIWPTSHLILFESLIPKLNLYLNQLGYVECKRFFNSHFHPDPRRRGDVVVMCLPSTT